MNTNNFFCKQSANTYGQLCTLPKGHKGKCSHTAISRVIEKIDKKAGSKLRTDSYMTPGNKGAAKNRADRCFPTQYTKQQIYEANKAGEYGICIPTRFSSTPEDCFQINVDLATQIVSIKDLEMDRSVLKKDVELQILDFLLEQSQVRFPHYLRCRICNEEILLENFYTGHATSHGQSVQLGHIVPHINGEDDSAHVAGNTQWIHRDCNIIQGEKTEEQTFSKLIEILENQGYIINKGELRYA